MKRENEMIDIENLTLAQIKQIAAIASQFTAPIAPAIPAQHDRVPVVVCTDKRGVVFGYTTDVAARPIRLQQARMCLYWSKDVGGVFGLGEKGPSKDCNISAVLGTVTLEGATAIFSVDDAAEKAWLSAKVAGR